MWGVGGEAMLPDFFLLFSFHCSADHERDWPPFCKVVFFGLATNTLNVRNTTDFKTIWEFMILREYCMGDWIVTRKL